MYVPLSFIHSSTSFRSESREIRWEQRKQGSSEAKKRTGQREKEREKERESESGPEVDAVVPAG